MPLFNKYEDLKDGPLKTKIEDLAKSLKFPLTKIYVCDASKRSSHSNAFFYGFCGNKRIVLFDTLIEQHTDEEIVAVVAHELGHWYHNHTLLGMIISFANMGLIFFLFSLVINRMEILTSFGFTKPSYFISLLLFFMIYTPVSFITSLLMNLYSRGIEFQADKFSKEIYKGEEND